MKAKEDEERTQEEDIPVEQPTQKEEVIEEVEEEVEDKPEEKFIEVDGEKISIDELSKSYLRQSDYTRKTQELAREKEEIKEALAFYNEVKNNPDAVNSLRDNVKIPRKVDPNQRAIIELEEQLYDMQLDNEINLMQSKYEDFEVRDVLEFAAEKKMTNLEDAYFLLKARGSHGKDTAKEPSVKDIESMRDEIKKEIMEELKSVSTGSIISSKRTDNVESTNEVKLSDSELKVAQGMGLSKQEYSKWRDAKA